MSNEDFKNNSSAQYSNRIPVESGNLSETIDALKKVNDIKDELCKLPLNTCEQEYILTNITPWLTMLDQLSHVGYDLSFSVSTLNASPIVHPKKHELKETTELIYKINDKCEDIYDVLKKKINLLLRIVDND